MNPIKIEARSLRDLTLPDVVCKALQRDLDRTMNTEIKILGRTFVTDDALTVGDYGGAGSVGYANKKWLYKNVKKDQTVDLYMDVLIGTVDGLKFDRTKFFHDYETTLNNGEYKQDRINLLSAIKDIRSAKLIRFYGGYNSESFYVAKNDPDLCEAVEALEDYPCFYDELVGEVEQEWRDQFLTDELSSIEYKVQTKLDRDDLEISLDQVYEAISDLDDSGGFFSYEYSGAYCDIDKIVTKICDQYSNNQEDAQE